MKRKINLNLSLIALLAIITTTIGFTIVYNNLFQIQVRNDLKQNAQLLIASGLFQNTYDRGKENTESLISLGSADLRITWIDAEGTVLFDNQTDISRMDNHLDRPEIRMAIKNGEGESTRHSDTLNMNTFYHAVLLDNGTVLRVSTQAGNVFSILFAVFPVILGIAAAVLLICIVIGHLLTRQIMKPLEDMTDDLDNSSIPAYKELEPLANRIRVQHENILAAAKSRQDFNANVSHELKTPITAISGYAELIENRMVEGESEIHAARQIRHNADRLLSLVNDTIRLSELDHSEIARTFEPTDLSAIAEECVRDLRPLADKKHIGLLLEASPAVINADPSLIREMMENLIQNGIRYNKESGIVMATIAVESGHPAVTVKDTGIGIPADQLDRIFERFYRVDKSRSRETGGTGLGLAIVKHIVELHSARMSINSMVGRGTEIKIVF